MKKTFLLIGLICILSLCVFVLAGCGKKEESEKIENTKIQGIVGSWEYTFGEYVYTFNEDKTGNYVYKETKMDFTYEDDGSKLSILYTGNTMPLELEYRIEGNKLIIKASFGTDVEYIKQ